MNASNRFFHGVISRVDNSTKEGEALMTPIHSRRFQRSLACLLLAAMLLVLLLIPIAAVAENSSEDAVINDNEVLVIQKVDFRNRGDYLQFGIHLKNNGTQGIEEFSLKYQFCNKFDEVIFMYPGTMEGLSGETHSTPIYFSPNKTIKKGSTHLVKESYWFWYTNANKMKVAVTYYRTSDGTKHYIPESKLAWFVSGEDYESVPVSNYQYDEATVKKAASLTVGFSYLYVYSPQVVEYYRLKHGGKWIVAITPDSIAEQCGMKAGDLLFRCDGIDLEDDPFAAEKAIAKLSDGEDVVFSVERNGETIDLVLSK